MNMFIAISLYLLLQIRYYELRIYLSKSIGYIRYN